MKVTFFSLFFGTLLSLNLLNSKISLSSNCDTTKGLFPIWIDNRYGFINQKGEVIIAPIYHNVDAFAEGLAPVRLNGTYGYIDRNGLDVIPSIYDYAEGFSEGYAKVFQDGKLFFINKKGERVWDIELNSATAFDKGISHVLIIKDSQRIEKVLDTLGQLHDPEAFLDWDRDLAIVKKNTDNWSNDQIGIKHRSGRMIVPFGKYKEIHEFYGDLAEVSYIDTTDNDDSDNWRYGFINREGELKFRLKKGMLVFQNFFSEGLLAVSTHIDSNDINSEEFITWIDTAGKTVFEKRSDTYATPFKTGRSFSGDNRNWYLMDKNGKQLSKNRFEEFGNNDFSKNRVLVAAHDTIRFSKLSEKWGVIDSMGEYIIPPQYDKVCKAEFQQEGLLVAIADTETNPKTNPKTEDPYTGESYHWGLIDTLGNWLIQPTFTLVNQNGFQNGLLYVEIDNVYGYVNSKGDFVWKANQPTETNIKIEPLNIAYMARGYNYVFPSDYKRASYSRDTSTKHLCLAKKIESVLQFPMNQLGIIARPTAIDTFQKRFWGFKAYIFNTTKDTLNIDVQDNCLYLTMQALDKKGVWRDIEYSPRSWCGNSYYDVALCPNEYWGLTVPIYDGDFETTLRLAFLPKKAHKNEPPPITIYSNTFKGKINPAQFWNKEGHTATNLMDPYID